MKTILSSALALVAAAAATTVQAADDVKLQLQWVTQAQFAGYYVALDKGFYAAEDLNVTIFARWARYRPPASSGRRRRGCDAKLDALRLGRTRKRPTRGEYCPAL